MVNCLISRLRTSWACHDQVSSYRLIFKFPVQTRHARTHLTRKFHWEAAQNTACAHQTRDCRQPIIFRVFFCNSVKTTKSKFSLKRFNPSDDNNQTTNFAPVMRESVFSCQNKPYQQQDLLCEFGCFKPIS